MPWVEQALQPTHVILESLVIVSILDFKKTKHHSIIILISLDFQIFWVPPPPLAVLRLGGKACSVPGLCCLNPPPHPTLPPFPNVSPAGPAPAEERKLVPSHDTKALSVSMQHTQQGGAKGRRRKTPHRQLKRKRNGILRCGP